MKFPHIVSRFSDSETGAGTALGLIFTVSLFTLGGLAIDVANAYRVRTQLQIAADSIAHAALYHRELNDAASSKALALSMLETMMPGSINGTVLTEQDIIFGTWDRDNRTFTPDPNSKSAVMVNTGRAKERHNEVPTHLLGFIELDDWDVRTASIFETYMPPCLREGFVAEDIVDVQSNNVYTNGFCIHSQTHVEVNTDNTFADNTVVSMPDQLNLVLPNSGFDTNDGLQEALRDRSYQIRILNRIVPIMADLKVAGPTYTPDYITTSGSTSVITLADRNLDQSNFTPGRVHEVNCNGNQQVFIKDGAVLSDVVLVTDCKIKFGQGTRLENTVIATSNTDAKSINAPSGLRIGRNDHCAPDGGAQILTMGGVDVAANMQMYGGQIIAKGDVYFSANANGLEGASIIAGGLISGTSNMTMGFCGSGMERNFEAEYFRLAY